MIDYKKTNNYLTREQIEILLKLCYLRKYTIVSKEVGITPLQVKRIEENALRCIRTSYSKSYIQGKKFNGKIVMRHMAERSGLTPMELTVIFDSYISEGLLSKDLLYWERVKRKNRNPTAIELLDFIFMKYELKILPFTLED